MAEVDRKAFRQITYGMYLITSYDGDRLNGQVANVAFLGASRPARLVISINKENLTHEFISNSKHFAVCVLEEETPMTLIGLFGFKSGRDVDKLSQVSYRKGETGCPVVTEHILSAMEAKCIDEIDVGTHTLFVGEVVSAEVLKEGIPLSYANYHLVKGGKSPRTSPTYIGDDEKPGAEPEEERKENMKKYVCNVCGYIYDPEVGDSDSGINPGTSFEDLPEDWVCPVCGVGKDEFSPVE